MQVTRLFPELQQEIERAAADRGRTEKAAATALGVARLAQKWHKKDADLSKSAPSSTSPRGFRRLTSKGVEVSADDGAKQGEEGSSSRPALRNPSKVSPENAGSDIPVEDISPDQSRPASTDLPQEP